MLFQELCHIEQDLSIAAEPAVINVMRQHGSGHDAAVGIQFDLRDANMFHRLAVYA